MTWVVILMAPLLTLELLVQLWRSREQAGANTPGAVAASVSPRLDLGGTLVVLGFAVAVLASVTMAIVIQAPHFLDDAYITYRYAANLAGGHGIVWNPGEAPIEGFTNLLLILITAPFVAVGLDPLWVTRVLSLAAIGGVALIVHRIARSHLGIAPPVAVMLALAYPVAGLSVEVAMIGLETVLFSFFLFAAFHQALVFAETRDARRLAACGLLAFTALLLRPEAVFLVAAVGGMLAVSRGGDVRQKGRWLLVLAGSFGPPLLLYLAWKLWYFGDVVPLPARIKIPGGGLIREMGFDSVSGYLLLHWRLLLAVLASLLIPYAPKRLETRLLASLLVTAYVLFYLRVDTLMDMHQRFMYPITPLLYFLAMPALAVAVEFVLRWRGALVTKGVVGLTLLCALFFQRDRGPVHFVEELRYGSAPQDNERTFAQVGEGLAEFDGIERLTIASQDAGLIPYLTHARHIDTAGLNNRFIATHRDVGELSDYVFSQRPDLIIHRSLRDGTLLTYAHGPLGDQTRWADHPGWDDYRYVGTVDQPDVHSLHFFVRRGTAVEGRLAEHIRTRVAERVEPEAPVRLGRLAAVPAAR